MRTIDITAMNKDSSSGVGMARIEYVGPLAAPVTFIGPSHKEYQFSKSPANKFAWVSEEDANFFCANPDFRRLVTMPPPVPEMIPFHRPVLEKVEERPVEIPATDKVQAAVTEVAPTVAEALAYDGHVWSEEHVTDVIKKKRGRKAKAN